MSVEIISLIRMSLAMFLGFFIGFERKMRFKEAGTRTHTIVCIGACLFMIISIFGFEGADTARVAAQIVSGIGFIGAGMIFYHKQMVHGLTTAAGIWATAAVGMASGAGMYIIAVSATLLIILVQCVMHLPFKLFHSHKYLRVNIIYTSIDGTENQKIKDLFDVRRFTKIRVEKEGDQTIIHTTIITDKLVSDMDILKAVNENGFIKSIAREDDDL